MVSDDVVKLAGDPGALGCRRDPGLRVPFGLEAGSLVLERGVVAAPVAHRVAEHPGEQRTAAEEYDAEQDPLEEADALQVHPHDDPDHRAGHARKQRGHRLAPGAVGRNRVQQHEERKIGRQRCPEHQLNHHARS